MAEGSSGAGKQPSEVRYLHPQIAPKTHVHNELLSRLIGYRLHSVQFAQSYLQFGFESARVGDFPILTCQVMPTVTSVAGTAADGGAGYADAIRSLIGDEVVDTAEGPNRGFRVGFVHRVLVLRPTARDLAGPVIATLSDFADGSCATWLPGGNAYEYLH